MKRTKTIFKKEQLFDMKLKLIASANYREQQVRRGYTVDCSYCNFEFDLELSVMVRKIHFAGFSRCISHITVLYELNGMENKDFISQTQLFPDAMCQAELSAYLRDVPEERSPA
jgi:hypothetical protein